MNKIEIKPKSLDMAINLLIAVAVVANGTTVLIAAVAIVSMYK